MSLLSFSHYLSLLDQNCKMVCRPITKKSNSETHKNKYLLVISSFTLYLHFYAFVLTSHISKILHKSMQGRINVMYTLTFSSKSLHLLKMLHGRWIVKTYTFKRERFSIQLDDPYYSYVDFCIDHLNLPSRQQRNVVQGYELDLVGKYFVQKVGPTIYSFIFLLP